MKGFVTLMFAGVVLVAQNPQAVMDRAVSDFESGRFAQSAAAFDELAAMVPDRAPHLWQRGIALYYAGRYADCRRQFEAHRTVNPDDVENAAWHFLCVARQENPHVARAALLPVGPDRRPPMLQIYQMFSGALEPVAMMKAGGSTPEGRFYAALYAGLYYDVLGHRNLALQNIGVAAGDQYARVGGYMHMVAKVHLRTLNR